VNTRRRERTIGIFGIAGLEVLHRSYMGILRFAEEVRGLSYATSVRPIWGHPSALRSGPTASTGSSCLSDEIPAPPMPRWPIGPLGTRSCRQHRFRLVGSSRPLLFRQRTIAGRDCRPAPDRGRCEELLVRGLCRLPSLVETRRRTGGGASPTQFHTQARSMRGRLLAGGDPRGRRVGARREATDRAATNAAKAVGRLDA
jgi:hypothetical protein